MLRPVKRMANAGGGRAARVLGGKERCPLSEKKPPGKRRRSRDPRRLVTAFWSGIVEDDGADMKDRLKASELLAKAVPQAADDAVTAIEVRIDYGDGGTA